MTEVLARTHARPPRSSTARLLGRSPLKADDRSWYWGALGEIAVGRRLARLGSEWTVLHAVPVGRGDADIDHVVVGPGGVFTINTKNHSGQKVFVGGRALLVAGKKQDHVRNSEHEAARAATRLSAAVGSPVEVRPLLVVVRPRSLTIGSKPAVVTVTTDAQLVRWLKKRPVVLSHERVRSLAEAAARPSSWRDVPVADGDPAAVRSAFSSLDREVRRAHRVRRLWAGALAACTVAGALTLGPDALAALLAPLAP
jgi:hypothetical protein